MGDKSIGRGISHVTNVNENTGQKGNPFEPEKPVSLYKLVLQILEASLRTERDQEKRGKAVFPGGIGLLIVQFQLSHYRLLADNLWLCKRGSNGSWSRLRGRGNHKQPNM